ncbi:hypothetical protein [Streptomyces sp. NPDC049590]|uniref:hypothetical protein n=1 Tax=Streptomyces sp. NPDC049590 TaxID=3154834 RepID=UPI0034260AEA
MLALAVVAGVSWTAVVVHGADRAPGAAGWRLPEASEGRPAESGGAGLGGLLLPYGEHRYRPGPDLNEFGSDIELTGAQTAALRKRSLARLPRSQRLAMERQIDRQPVKGMALRSYVGPAGASAGSDAEEFTVQITLARVADRRTAHSLAAAQRLLLGSAETVREGPAIKGHEGAACFLPPKDVVEGLDAMLCVGSVGDVVLTASATGTEALDRQEVADMVTAQFDRIKDPGKAV